MIAIMLRAAALVFAVGSLAGCFAVPTIEPAIPVLSGQVTKAGRPVAGARILVSSRYKADACQSVRTVALTDASGNFHFAGEKTLQLAPLAGDPTPHWEVCIEHEGKVWPGFRPFGYGLQKEMKLQCEIDNGVDATTWKGIC